MHILNILSDLFFIAQVYISHAYGVLNLNQVFCGWLVWIMEQGPQIYSDR